MIGRSIYTIIFLAVLALTGWVIIKKPQSLKAAPEVWADSVQPGELSKFHSNLANDCSQCHSPYRGVIREQCVTCHAAPTELLKKENTTFHSSITSCTGCHLEHQGKDASITKMDHTHLALVAAEMLKKSNSSTKYENPKYENNSVAAILQATRKSYHGTDTALEKTLNCVSCHRNQDRHQSLFGSDCSTCHDAVKWSIASFRHPLPTSRDCSQCHQAPPSHYMMHFEMISKKVAGQEDAKGAGCCGPAQVNQCYRCHQTTSWNDIPGVGYYKHH